MERKIKHQVRGRRVQDGAGVQLVRVLGPETTKEYDPILMLDSFDSVDPREYEAGFPMHPHRGMETISYVARGTMLHRDTLGNEHTVSDGELQWMTAGSGILHEEQLPASDRMLGVQLWLNLPKKDKMASPSYHGITNQEIKEIPFENGKVRLLAGTYQDQQGHMGDYLPLDYYDIHLEEGASIVIDTKKDRSVMIFTLLGDAYVGGTLVYEKTAAKLTEGDFVEIKSAGNKAQVLFISSKAVEEPIAWGGPIVMNTREELQEAFQELNEGNFLKKEMVYEDQ